MRPGSCVILCRDTLNLPVGAYHSLGSPRTTAIDHCLHGYARFQGRPHSKQHVRAAKSAPNGHLPATEVPVKRQRLLQTAADPLKCYAPVSGVRGGSLGQLQAFLGYQFNSEQLLQQACTHSPDKGALSYRQLAFVGDAALWMLFAEHAFNAYGHKEDPISGAWPTHLSALLSRVNLASTARQWGLQHYLQHSQQQQQPAASPALNDRNGSGSSSITSNNSSYGSISSTNGNSSKGRDGMYQGSWSSDSLAEMFEGVIGALLLDSTYCTVQQLLQPWVAEALETSRRAAAASAAAAAAASPGAASAAAVSAGAAAGAAGAATAAILQQADLATRYSSTSTGGSSSHPSTGSNGSIDIQQQALHIVTVLQQQLQTRCSYCFQKRSLLESCSRHVVLLLTRGSSSAENEKWHFLGYSLLQYAAAQHIYRCQCSKQPTHMNHDSLPYRMVSDSRDSSSSRNSSSSSNSSSTVQQREHNGSSSDDESSSSSGSSSSSSSGPSCSSSSSNSSSNSKNVLQLMSKQMVQLTTIRHRCKMWLWLGLDPAPWCPADSYLFKTKWKVQKQLVSRCLDLLLAAVYLDGGLEAAVGVAGVLLAGTPPTGIDKPWIPTWANKGPAAAVITADKVSGGSCTGLGNR